MTENEKKLLKTDNKRKIKEINGLNTDKEEFEMIETTLNISRNKLSQSEIDNYKNQKIETVKIFCEKYNVILSKVFEFKIRQLWDMIKSEIQILKKEFSYLKAINFNDMDKFDFFQLHTEEITYLMDALGDTFRELANKKAKKECYDDMIMEYVYKDLNTEDLFLSHPFYKSKNLDSYILSVEDSIRLLCFIQSYIDDIVNDLTKEKCITGADMLMVVSVEIEGIYRYKKRTR